MSQIQSVQQFPCLRNLSDFVSDSDSTDTIEKMCRVTIHFFLTIPAMIIDLLLYLPLEAYNGRFCSRDSSDLVIDYVSSCSTLNSYAPSAPPFPLEPPVSKEVHLARDVSFLRTALKDHFQKNMMEVHEETFPYDFNITPFIIASLALFHFLDQVYRPQSFLKYWPTFIALGTSDKELPSLREIGVGFYSMTQAEKNRIEKELKSPDAIISFFMNSSPSTIEDPVTLQIKHHAFKLSQDPNFLTACQALKIDLLAD